MLSALPVESAADALFAEGAAPLVAWSFNADENVSESPVLASDGTIFVPDRGDRIIGLKDGVKTWEYRLKKHVPGDAIKTPVFTPDGTMLVSVSNTLHALKGGSPSWSFSTGDPWVHMGAPACGPDGTVNVSDSSGALHALKEGKSLWSVKDSPWNLTGPAVGPGGTVYVARRSDGKVIAIKNGEILWEYKTSRKWRRNCNDRISKETAEGLPISKNAESPCHRSMIMKSRFALSTGKRISQPKCLTPKSCHLYDLLQSLNKAFTYF